MRTSSEIRRRTIEASRVICEEADATVARLTQQPAHTLRDVAMVYIKPFPASTRCVGSADRAATVLSRKQRRVRLWREAVLGQLPTAVDVRIALGKLARVGAMAFGISRTPVLRAPSHLFWMRVVCRLRRCASAVGVVDRPLFRARLQRVGMLCIVGTTPTFRQAEDLITPLWNELRAAPTAFALKHPAVYNASTLWRQ